MGSDETNLHDTIDAAIWAAEFKRLFPESDESLMLGWFANAIMAGFDESERRNQLAVKQRDEALALLRRVEWVDDSDHGFFCAMCGRHRHRGHARDCELAALLADTKRREELKGWADSGWTGEAPPDSPAVDLAFTAGEALDKS